LVIVDSKEPITGSVTNSGRGGAGAVSNHESQLSTDKCPVITNLGYAVTLFLALCFFGVAIGGFTAFVIFWPLSLVHLRDRHPGVRGRFGENAFMQPAALRWLLSGSYYEVPDRQFTGLATPARISLMVILGALAASAVLWLWSIAP